MNLRIKTRWILFGIGLMILTFGARVLLLANIGLGGIDALVVGLFRLFGGSIGLWIDVVSIIIVIIASIIKKKGIQWTPILVSILLGFLYDMWGKILFNRLELHQDTFIQGLVFLVGILITPLGTALYIYANISTSCMDCWMLALKDRFHLSLGASRILLEAIFIISACLVKGPIGIGTIMIMLLSGVILQTYYRMIEKIAKKKRHI